MEFKILTSVLALSLIMTSHATFAMEENDLTQGVIASPVPQIAQEQLLPPAEKKGFLQWLWGSKVEDPKREGPIIVTPPSSSDESEVKEKIASEMTKNVHEEPQSPEIPVTPIPSTSKGWVESVWQWWQGSEMDLSSNSFTEIKREDFNEKIVKSALSQSTELDIEELKKAIAENDHKKFQEKIAAISEKGPKAETEQ